MPSLPLPISGFRRMLPAIRTDELKLKEPGLSDNHGPDNDGPSVRNSIRFVFVGLAVALVVCGLLGLVALADFFFGLGLMPGPIRWFAGNILQRLIPME